MSKYGLKFENKAEVCVDLLKDHHTYLTEDLVQSFVRDDKRHHNLLIEGENYHALKTLQYTHDGKIDIIYIDSPYNTGNKDFVYNDDFVDSEDVFRHSKWLSFMSKRLELARALLSTRGLIFLSIDDNEIAQLKLLCDQIFGEQNKLACITVVNNLKGRSDADNYAPCHEYLLVYAETYQKDLIRGRPLTVDEASEYSLKDDISAYKLIQLKKTGAADKREDRPNMYYPIYYSPISGEINLEPITGGITIVPLRADGSDGRWSWGSETFSEHVKTEIVVDFKSGKYNVYQKMRDVVSNGDARTRKYKTVWNEPQYSTTTSADEIKKIFGEKSMFDFAKPLSFIKDIVRSASQKDSIILDFFAGSGTTGQAVAELNKEDGGTRQFILITNNDVSDKLPLGICTQVTLPRLTKTIDNENLKYLRVETLAKDGKHSSDHIDQLVNGNKLLTTLKIQYNTFDEVENTTEYSIFTNHDKSFFLGVWHTDIEPNGKAFRQKMNAMGKNKVLVCRYDSYPKDYYNTINRK